MRKGALALAVLLAPLAGCLSAGPGGPEGVSTYDPTVVPGGVDWWEDFATRWAKRDRYLPQNDEAHEHIAAEMAALGFDVEVRAYAASEEGVDLPQMGPVEVHAVVATRPGTTQPDHWIGVTSHFDTETKATEGAYDNAAGTAVAYTLCRSLAEVELEKTLACLFFDGEEAGLVASGRFVDDFITEADEGVTFDYVLGYDMVGINWPGHEWGLYILTGGEAWVPALGGIARGVVYDDLGWPSDRVVVKDTHDRNSDELRFSRAGVPVYRFAGGKTAGEYEQYHMPGDTVEYVYDLVGGRPNFEAGFGAAVEASHRLVETLDRTDPAGLLQA